MSSRSEILANQQRWAEARSLQPDARGYLPNVRDNLFQPLSDSALRSFERGSGNELTDTAARPAKMKALHSSSALAVNFFDYWSETKRDSLTTALGLSSSIQSIVFEAQYPTRLSGNPPNVDVALHLDNGYVVGIESKFTEWLNRKPENAAPFKQRYFESASPLWSTAKLPRCQALAESLRDGEVSYSYLDAAQLLKHALGMGTMIEGNWFLYYCFFNWSGREAKVHCSEIEDFSARVGTEIGFRAVAYQELVGLLKAEKGKDSAYMEYISSRYTACAA